jgi:hypothetical protein
MNVTLRQGIIRPYYLDFPISQIPSAYSVGQNNVSILSSSEDRLLIVLTYLRSNYLHIEDSEKVAWTNLPGGNSWLYWDLDTVTGDITYGYTQVEPDYGSTLPPNPVNDQHFFLQPQNAMKVWNGSIWRDRIRVFAGKYNGQEVDNSDFLDNISQVGLNGPTQAGFLLYDNDNNPIKANDRFITTETTLKSKDSHFNKTKIQTKRVDGRSIEPIGKYSCVTWKGRNRRLGVAKSTDRRHPCIGIAVNNFFRNQVNSFVTQGYITDPIKFNWDIPINSPLFVGADGSIVSTPPRNISIQKIGYVVDRHTIYVDIKERVLIDPAPEPIPTPTPTPTPIPDSVILAGINSKNILGNGIGYL